MLVAVIIVFAQRKPRKSLNEGRPDETSIKKETMEARKNAKVARYKFYKDHIQLTRLGALHGLVLPVANPSIFFLASPNAAFFPHQQGVHLFPITPRLRHCAKMSFQKMKL